MLSVGSKSARTKILNKIKEPRGEGIGLQPVGTVRKTTTDQGPHNSSALKSIHLLPVDAMNECLGWRPSQISTVSS
jgi:hypothetical protein